MKRDVSKESKINRNMPFYYILMTENTKCLAIKLKVFFSSTVLAGLGGDMSNSFYDPCTFLLIAKHNSNEENISNYS